MTVTITAFESSPDKGRGLARDMRVRWALEEAGQPYAVRLVSFAEMKQPAHMALHPFGQIPTYEEDGLALFESGGIILHIAQTRPGLLPADPQARARAQAWMFAALNSVEPTIVDLEEAEYLEGDKSWHAERMAMIEERVRTMLDRLAARLGEAEWIDGGFSAADVLLVTVLRRLEDTDILADYPTLTAYIARGVARPAYQRAYADQHAVFEASVRDGSA